MHTYCSKSGPVGRRNSFLGEGQQKATCVQMWEPFRQTGRSLVSTQTPSTCITFCTHTTHILWMSSKHSNLFFCRILSQNHSTDGASFSYNDNFVIRCFEGPNRKRLFCTDAEGWEKGYLIYVFNRLVSTFVSAFPNYWFFFASLEQVCAFQIWTEAFFPSPFSIYILQCFGCAINF